MHQEIDRTVLVTGSTGFIGLELVKSLQEKGFVVRSMGRQAANLDNHFMLDLAALEYPSALFEGISTVFHLAGKAHDLVENSQDAAEYRQINTEGTRKLLEAAQQVGVKSFIFFSSVKAVGITGTQWIDESATAWPDTPYGQSKYEAEQLVLLGGYVPHPVVIRPSMVYGNADKGNLPRMIKAIARGFFPPLPETHNRRSMVHVDDVVRAAILVAEKPESAGQIYIVTDGVSYSTRQIYDWIRAALGKSQITWSIPLSLLKGLAKVGDMTGRLIGRRFIFDSAALEKLIGSAWYSSAKIETELGFRPQTTLQQSLPDIVRFLKIK